MIYANFNSGNAKIYADKGFLRLEDWDIEDKEPIFYYDRHDMHINKVLFKDFLTQDQWKAYNDNPKSKILINYADDFFTVTDLEAIIRAIKTYQIRTDGIVIINMDKQVADWVAERLKIWGITDTKCLHFNQLLKNVTPPTIDIPPTHKFSILSRNYYDWRLEFYLELLKRDILDNSIYSFHNLKPYNKKEDWEVNIEEVKNDAFKMGFHGEKIKEWLKGIPYDIGAPDQKWANVTSNCIQSSDIHIIVESHFDPFLGHIYDRERQFYPDSNEFAPSFITEKTWKGISCRKPFIMYSTPQHLKRLQLLGYKTFSPYIDESYDLIEDNKERFYAIVDEIERINKLPQKEFIDLIVNIQPIINHNFKVLMDGITETSAFESEPILESFLPLVDRAAEFGTLDRDNYKHWL